MRDIVDFVLVQELLVDDPGSVCDNLINPPVIVHSELCGADGGASMTGMKIESLSVGAMSALFNTMLHTASMYHQLGCGAALLTCNAAGTHSVLTLS